MLFISAEKELLRGKGLNTNDFQNVLVKFQNERRVQEVFYLMQVCSIALDSFYLFIFS